MISILVMNTLHKNNRGGVCIQPVSFDGTIPEFSVHTSPIVSRFAIGRSYILDNYWSSWLSNSHHFFHPTCKPIFLAFLCDFVQFHGSPVVALCFAEFVILSEAVSGLGFREIKGVQQSTEIVKCVS
jgi:hypothetical protein